jgi:hypothetical protein
VATGNLAASYAAAVVNQLVISALQRYAQERVRKVGGPLELELEGGGVAAALVPCSWAGLGWAGQTPPAGPGARSK